MAFFFPRTVSHQNSEASFSPLFRLLSDVDRLSRRNRDVCYVYRTPAPRPWNPRFQVQETADEYVLRGELPDLAKENITVDFPTPQKLVIRGKVVEGESPAPTQPAPQVEEASTTTAPAPSSPVSESGRSRSSFQATVEDDDESEDFDIVSNFSEKAQEQSQEQPVHEEEEAKLQPSEVTKTQPSEQQTNHTPTQRILREFSRTFTFPAPVNYEATIADLKDGLLTIVVPKPTNKPRRITIN